MRGGFRSRVAGAVRALYVAWALVTVHASPGTGADGPEEETRRAPAGRGDVLLFVRGDDGPHPGGRLSLPTLRFVPPENGPTLAPATGIRTAAVAVDLGAAAGLRTDAAPLGHWRFDGALQEGPPRPEPGVPAPGHARAAEVRLAGREVFGRGRAAVTATRRNFDPASGLLLVNGTRSLAADPDTAGVMRAELGMDLLQDRRLSALGVFSLRVSASRERTDPTAPALGILSTLSPSLDDVLARHAAPAVAWVDGRRAEERPGMPPLVFLPAASRTDSVELDAELAPDPPAEGEPPVWAANLKIGFREVRRFEQNTIVGRRRGPVPAAVPDMLDASQLLVAGLRVRRTRLTYRFTLLSPEGLPGRRDPARPDTFSHQLEAATLLGPGLRLNLGLLRIETENDRFARDLSSLHSVLGLQWSFAPRWSLSGNVRSLGSSGPGSGAFARGLGLDALLTRAVRVPLLPRAAAAGELYARASWQDDTRRPGPAAPRLDQRLWGSEAGIRLLF